MGDVFHSVKLSDLALFLFQLVKIPILRHRYQVEAAVSHYYRVVIVVPDIFQHSSPLSRCKKFRLDAQKPRVRIKREENVLPLSYDIVRNDDHIFLRKAYSFQLHSGGNHDICFT